MTTPFQPLPCDAGGGGGSDAIDTEQTLLCDVMPNGDVVGSALAVYEYDATGAPVGAPTFVDPVTGLPYVPQGVLQPCSDTLSHAVEILCDVNDVDGSSVTFERVKTIGPAGTVLSVSDFGLDGAPYVPQFTVQLCDPHATCTPDSNLDLNADCGPGEAVTQQVLLDDVSAPLSNSVFNDDDTADPLCGGTWDRPADALPPGFPVAETFRNTTFDQPGPVTQANWSGGPFLTAGPPTNDGAGAGWIRLSDGSYAGGGVWQVPTPFSTSQGMNAAVTLASHDGTTPGGDGQYFVFTDGSAPPQSTLVGGFGNLGLNNIDAGVFAVVLDEYGQSCSCGQGVPSDPNPGPCAFCPNTISIQRAGTSRVGASCACCTIASAPLAPKAINQTTRSSPLRLLTSVISEGGQTYVSASVDWNDGQGPVQYFDRVNITSCITVPPTLRMGLVMNSGGAFQAVKEARDAVARPAGVSNWRSFPIVTDPIPACVTLVNINASVDVTPTDDGTQTAGNGNPEVYFWLVNTATNTVVDRDQYSIIPSQLGQVQTLTVSASVPVADLPNLRLYVGAESRDEVGEYSTTWENLTIDATGAGCPATPRRTMEISARCPIPVAIVSGGGGDGGGGGTTVVNTPSTFEDAIICATVGGVPTTAFRREVRTPDGGVEVTFLGFNGLGITPDGGWTPGPCPTRDGQTLGPVCYATIPPGPVSQSGFMTLDADGDPVLYNLSGAVVADGTYTIVICPLLTQQSHILCDAGNADHPFLRWYVDSPIVGVSDQQWDFELDGSTPYAPVGPVGTCGASGAADAEIKILCDANGTQFLRRYLYDEAGAPAGFLDLDLNFAGFAPVNPIGICKNQDAEVVVICDANGVPFLRRYAYDEGTGTYLGHVDRDLNGLPYVPAEPVNVCTSGTAGRDVEQAVLCDDNGPFLRVYQYGDDTGTPSGVPADYTLAGAAYVPVGAVADCSGQVPEVLALCDITQVPGLNGARSALNLTTLPAGPTAGAFGNGITFTVDQGLAGGSGTYLINTNSTQTWTFGQPAMLRYGVNNLNVGAECVTLPAGTVVESIHPNHTYNALTRVLCNGGAAAPTDESIFTLDAATTLAITSNPGGGGQRGLVRLEAGLTTFTEVRTPFLRTICRTCGEAPVITDTGMDGITPYVPVGTVSVCDVPFTPAAAAAVIRDSESFVLCSSTPAPGTQFIRTRVYNELGVVVATVDTTLAGAPFVPGVVSVCTQSVATDFDFLSTVLCDANGTAFIQRLTFNSATGAVTATTNTTLTGGAFAPVAPVGVCSSCCPAVIGEGCTSVGSGHYTAIRAVNGTITLIDSVTGATVLAASIIPCPGDDTVQTLTAQARLLTAGQSWTPGTDVAGTLTGLSFTVLTGTANVTDSNGTTSSGLPPGVTGAWNTEDDNVLTGPTAIDAIGGNTWVTWTQR